MQTIVESLLGNVADPIEKAMIFMIFLAVIDALFSFIGTLFIGVISK